MHSVTSTTTLSARVKVRLRFPSRLPERRRSGYVGPLTTRRASRYDPQAPSEFSRPKSAKAARAVNVTTKAAAADDKSSADGEESNFWKKVFLKDGEKEVSSGDYQEWQAELAAKKAANKEKAAAKEGGCVIM